VSVILARARVRLVTVASIVLVAMWGVALVDWAGAKGAAAVSTVSSSFASTGAEQTFAVPSNVSSVQIAAVGGSAGQGGGGTASASVSVKAGSTLYIEVGGYGGVGSVGWNGGGSEAGDGGGAAGSPGGSGSDDVVGDWGGGGGAGTLSTFGAGGEGGFSEFGTSGSSGEDGAPGHGGAGASSEFDSGGGGGGGGYYGGGGGGSGGGGRSNCFGGSAGGGGGSSYAPGGTTGVLNWNAWTSVTISYTVPSPPGLGSGSGATSIHLAGPPHLKPRSDGTIGVTVKVPGPGGVKVLVTAWKDNLANVAVLLKPAPRRFVFARTGQCNARSHPSYPGYTQPRRPPPRSAPSLPDHAAALGHL
jgi:hypothetical protein